MPPRSAKMNRFIFGFQRRVWWPKWTLASSKSFMETTDTVFLSVVFGTAGGPREEPAQYLQPSVGTASRASAAGSGTEARFRVATAVQLSAVPGVETSVLKRFLVLVSTTGVFAGIGLLGLESQAGHARLRARQNFL